VQAWVAVAFAWAAAAGKQYDDMAAMVAISIFI
jgi:hypothetical protein